MTDASNLEKMSYSEAISKLEEIVGKMRSPECDIDKLAGYTETAIALLKLCRTKLTQTNDKLRRSLEQLDADAAV